MPSANRSATSPPRAFFRAKSSGWSPPAQSSKPGLLPGDANNYLASIVLEDGRAGIAYVDITTGEFAVTELDAPSDSSASSSDQAFAPVRAELTRLRPAEIIHPDNLILPNGIPGHLTAWPAWRFEPGKCQETLLAHFGASTLDGFGLQGMPLAIRAAGGILQYLKETEGAALALLSGLRYTA